MAARLELVAQLAEVVDLAVEDDPDVPSSLAIGCRPRVEVDDRQPALPEADAGRDVDALTVGTAMHDRAAHPVDERALDGLPVKSTFPQCRT